MAYEYQSGKWASDGFQQEPYQVQSDSESLTDLDVMTNSTHLMAELEEGFSGTSPPNSIKPAMGIFTSESAVIADEKYMAL